MLSALLPLIVLPTRVGMVRWGMARGRPGVRSPHPRGDGPDMAAKMLVEGLGSPHPRGDGPRTAWLSTDSVQFSPPAWGWSGEPGQTRIGTGVLPTRVGMVRSSTGHGVTSTGSPHPRGDGPHPFVSRLSFLEFSPPAWGWSFLDPAVELQSRVLPTRVGMVRHSHLQPPAPGRSPHPRGDGPRVGRSRRANSSFSPPAWGWSGHLRHEEQGWHVLPTRVGMVLAGVTRTKLEPSSPHPRGDGPETWAVEPYVTEFSPPAWGWSAL